MMCHERGEGTARAVARAVLCGVVWLVCCSYAQAQVGEQIVEVRLEQEGRRVDDPVVSRLIETRIGGRLDMTSVRHTVTHLMSLERFDDVQVFADRTEGGVRIRYLLVPRHPVDRMEFRGALGLPEERLRRAVVDRYGTSPRAGQVADIEDELRQVYRRSGYVEARVTSRVIETHDPDRATLVFEVVAGRRLPVTDVRFTQVDAGESSDIIELPNIRVGQPYDAEQIDSALRTWEDDMRERGYYESRGSHGDQFADDGVFVAVNLTRGPLVVLKFAGDVVPREDRERLVPIRAEGSADEDLLEDSSRAIEEYLRAAGYRDSDVVYTRQEQGGELVITFDVTRGPRYQIRQVMITGNVAIADPALRALIPLKEGTPLVQAELGRVASDIQRLYRSRGFTKVVVEPRVAVLAPERASETDRQADVELAISEGPQTLVRSVAFSGNASLDEAALRTLVRVAVSEPYADATVLTDRDRIDLEYRDRGYENVLVTPTVTLAEDDTQADISFTISEGRQSRVDHIIVIGNRRISTTVIDRELLLREGEPLGYSALIESRARLVALGLFRRIQIEPLGMAGQPLRDVLVEVEESPPTVLSFGGGVEGGFRLRPTGEGGQAEERFELAPRGFFQIGRRNLWGKNRSVNLFTRVSLRSRDSAPAGVVPDEGTSSYGFNEYRVLGTFREPRVFETGADALVTAIVEQAIRSSFNFTRRELRAQAGLRLSSLYSVAGLYSFQRIKLFDERFTPDEKPIIDRLFPQVLISKISGSLIRDSRDDALDASRGTLFAVDGDLAARALGSEVGFVKAYVQGFFYRRLPGARRVIAAFGARVGAAHGYPRNVDGVIVQDLPASERFFAGGDTSVRGFALDRLGNERTITPTGFPTGGNGVIVLNSELRVGVWGGLQAVGFLDAGNVFPRASDLDFTDLRPAAGFGMMYRSPVGPIRVDVGFNLDPRELLPGTRERRTVLHILLGQPF